MAPPRQSAVKSHHGRRGANYNCLTQKKSCVRNDLMFVLLLSLECCANVWGVRVSAEAEQVSVSLWSK